jgi:hypothetical protein
VCRRRLEVEVHGLAIAAEPDGHFVLAHLVEVQHRVPLRLESVLSPPGGTISSDFTQIVEILASSVSGRLSN